MGQPDTNEIFDRALELEPAKRLSLADRLLESVEGPEDEEWAEAWATELDARLKRVESGEERGEAWEVVKARALAGLGRR